MDAKIKELLTDLSFFAEDGMGEPKLVEFAKKADALLLEVARKQNTQQPVAEVYYGNYGGNTRGIGFVSVRSLVANDKLPPPGTQLYHAPPVPRDVLMAALRDMVDECVEICDVYSMYDGKRCASELRQARIMDVKIAAIADRYAGKVQLEPVCQTCGGAGVIGDYLTLAHDCPDCARCDSDPELVSYSPDMATCTLRIGDEQYLFDRHVDEPEPVNQQMMQVFRAKLKSRRDMARDIPADQRGWWFDVSPGQTLNLRQAVQADLDRCRLDAPRSQDPADYMCETMQNGSLVSKVAIEYMHPEQNVFAARAAEAASAQPVAVPDEWQAAMAFARAALAEAIQIAPLDRLPVMAGAAMQQIDALLSAAQKPEGV